MQEIEETTWQGGVTLTGVLPKTLADCPQCPNLVGGAVRMTVLLVDSRATSRKELSQVLRECEYEVLTAHNRKQALKLLSTAQGASVRVILKEHEPPRVDARRMISALAQKGMDVPVVVMSSQNDPGEVLRCLYTGAVDYLVRPLRHNELKMMWMRIWISHQRQTSNQRSSPVKEVIQFSQLADPVSDSTTQDESSEDDDRQGWAPETRATDASLGLGSDKCDFTNFGQGTSGGPSDRSANGGLPKPDASKLSTGRRASAGKSAEANSKRARITKPAASPSKRVASHADAYNGRNLDGHSAFHAYRCEASEAKRARTSPSPDSSQQDVDTCAVVPPTTSTPAKEACKHKTANASRQSLNENKGTPVPAATAACTLEPEQKLASASSGINPNLSSGMQVQILGYSQAGQPIALISPQVLDIPLQQAPQLSQTQSPQLSQPLSLSAQLPQQQVSQQQSQPVQKPQAVSMLQQWHMNPNLGSSQMLQSMAISQLSQQLLMPQVLVIPSLQQQQQQQLQELQQQQQQLQLQQYLQQRLLELKQKQKEQLALLASMHVVLPQSPAQGIGYKEECPNFNAQAKPAEAAAALSVPLPSLPNVNLAQQQLPGLFEAKMMSQQSLDSHLSSGNIAADKFAPLPTAPSHTLAQEPVNRLEALKKWREKRKKLNFSRPALYADRKAWAECRPREKGRFIGMGRQECLSTGGATTASSFMSTGDSLMQAGSAATNTKTKPS